MKRFLLLLILVLPLCNNLLQAQHQELSEKPGIWKMDSIKKKDNQKDILSAFKTGHVSGHFRYFFMATDNQKGLSDYFANAAGGGIRYETNLFHHFQFGVSGFYSYDIGSSDLSKTDSATGQSNRYEIGLFDIENTENKKDMDRLEELFLKYQWSKSSVIIGKQLMNTPFINLQDGRMRPTVVEGISSNIHLSKSISLEAAYLYSISPRSTTRFYDIASSIGLYSTGVNIDGTKSGYKNQLQSDGVILAALHYRPNSKSHIKIWQQTVTGIFHSSMVQGDYTLRETPSGTWTAALQSVAQWPIGDGGNPDPSKTYYDGNANSLTLGARMEWTNKHFGASLNYNRITSHGRYLMPREWGRDPFFTFMPRERNEGLGDVHAIMGKLEYRLPAHRFKSSVSAGYYNLPDVKNYRLNKYGMPSYAQFNVDVRYELAGMLKPLEFQLLYVYKADLGETYESPKFVFNKVDMSHVNLVLNYRF